MHHAINYANNNAFTDFTFEFSTQHFCIDLPFEIHRTEQQVFDLNI